MKEITKVGRFLIEENQDGFFVVDGLAGEKSHNFPFAKNKTIKIEHVKKWCIRIEEYLCFIERVRESAKISNTGLKEALLLAIPNNQDS